MRRLFSPVILAIVLYVTNGCATFLDNASAVKTARIHIKLGYGYIEQNNLELARQKLIKALAIAPELPETQDAMAYLSVRLGENVEAEVYYQKALALSHDDPKILNNYGTFLCRMGNFTAAEQYFLKAVHNPLYETPQEAYENMGLCALMCVEEHKGKDCGKKAELYFNKALSYDQDRPASTAGLAQLHRKLTIFKEKTNGYRRNNPKRR